MREPYTQLYLHLVWSTWDRMPLIRPDLREGIYGCILDQVRKHRCETIAIGGLEDHVHLLVRFHPMTRISEMVQHAKGASSHLVTQVLDPGGFFKWQGYYGAFTISRQQAPHVRDYILRQQEHHLGGTIIETLERIFHGRARRHIHMPHPTPATHPRVAGTGRPIDMNAILALDVDCRIELVTAIWDSIAAEQPAPRPTDGDMAEIQRRIDAYRQDPSRAIPFETVMKRLEERYP